MKMKQNFNTKKDNHFDKINALIDDGKYNHSMDDVLNKAHSSLGKDKMKEFKK